MEIFGKKIVVTTLHGLCSSLLLLLCEQPQRTPQSATGCGSRVTTVLSQILFSSRGKGVVTSSWGEVVS